MKNHESNSWVEAVIIRAQEAGWCMSPYCTTCGCMEFRRAYWSAAAQQAKLASRFETTRPLREILNNISAAERGVLVQTLVAGLRELSPIWAYSEAFRTIIIDLDPPFILHGIPMSLDDELFATPAGEALAGMRVFTKKSRERSELRKAYESPQAVEKRKRIEQENRASAHASRLFKTLQRNSERLKLLANIALLSPANRLSLYASDSTLNLDWLSTELIKVQQSDLIGFDKATASALIARIGRRKGEWGCLRRMLEKLVNDNPPF